MFCGNKPRLLPQQLDLTAKDFALLLHLLHLTVLQLALGPGRRVDVQLSSSVDPMLTMPLSWRVDLILRLRLRLRLSLSQVLVLVLHRYATSRQHNIIQFYQMT